MVLVLAAVGWKLKPHHHDPLTLWGHRWVDHEPRDERDVFREAHFYCPTYEGEPYRGTFLVGSRWRHQIEWFEYDRFESWHSDLHLQYLQTGTRDHFHVTLTECNENGYEYCLDGCDSHPDHAATRTDFRSGRSVSAIASLHRSLVASARS